MATQGSELSRGDAAVLGDTAVLTRLDKAVAWARKFSIFPYPFATACCAMEYMSLSMTPYDIDRFGALLPRFTPRQADLLMVIGTVTVRQAPILRRVFDQMAEPKWVMAFGACASTGGFYDNYATLPGIDRIVPVDVYVPGCPPRPESVLDALMALQRKIQGQKQKLMALEPGRLTHRSTNFCPLTRPRDDIDGKNSDSLAGHPGSAPVSKSTRRMAATSALRKALFEMTPEQLINEVKNSNLRGRGGAAFPTGVKWSFIPKDSKKPVYVCCNADESEPGTFANRYELENDPHGIIEGILICLPRGRLAYLLRLHARRVLRCRSRASSGARRGARAGLRRQEHHGLGLRSRDNLDASRRRRVHLRRGDRTARIARRQARVSAQPSAVSGDSGRVRMPHRGQQCRDALQRPAHHHSRRRVV